MSPALKAPSWRSSSWRGSTRVSAVADLPRERSQPCREEKERVLRENIAALADALFADHIKPRDDEWDCPACAQVERIRDRVRRTTTVCLSCGVTFAPPRADARYCSPLCRRRAYRRRNQGDQP